MGREISVREAVEQARVMFAGLQRRFFAILLVSGVYGMPADTAYADDCLTAPTSSASGESQWLNGVYLGNVLKCWYLRATGQPEQKIVVQDSSTAVPARRSQLVHRPPAPTPKAAPPKTQIPLARDYGTRPSPGVASSRCKSFDVSKVDPVLRKALEDAPATAQQLMAWKVPTIARVVNYWSMNTDTMGVYGNYYLKRAMIAQLGLGANLPEDAIYPLNLADETGKPLDGASKYTIHFDKGATPPVNAFWSVTLYDSDGFQVANSLNRFAVSSWMPFKYNPDGSLDLYFQNESPGANKEANWLPAPKGPFNLTMRLYAPKSEALTGKWNPPPITKIEGTSNLMAQ